ncbi:hypothetical protein V0R37_22650, partial [Pollutimonas sp. H1-120]
AEIREEYEKVRERNANRRPKAADLDYTQARKRRFRTDWATHTPVAPRQPGLMIFGYLPASCQLMKKGVVSMRSTSSLKS